MTRSVGDLLADQLRLLGAASVYRSASNKPVGFIDEVVVDDDAQAMLLADVDGRLSGGFGAALVTGAILHVSSQPGGRTAPVSVSAAEEMISVLATLAALDVPATAALHLDLDLAAPAPQGIEARIDASPGVAVTLHPSFADASVAVVVGPGVVRGRHLAGLREMALAGGMGVVNTWGAKGVFRWDSPYHFGTAGLQARDFELAGISSADLVVTCGLDPDETPLDLLGSYAVQDVAGWQLPALVANWPRPVELTERPALFAAIAAVVTPMYESSATPIEPPRAALHLSGACPDGGVVVADAGLAGFWLARTFPTGVVGSIVVPAIDQPGFAIAAAIAARRAGRPCVAVLDGPLDEDSERLLEVAERLGLGFGVQIWADLDTVGAPLSRDVSDHVEVTRRGFESEEIDIADVAIDTGGLEQLVEVAGPIVAWGLGPES